MGSSPTPTDAMCAALWSLFQVPSPAVSVRPYICMMKKPLCIRSSICWAEQAAAPQVRMRSRP